MSKRQGKKITNEPLHDTELGQCVNVCPIPTSRVVNIPYECRQIPYVNKDTLHEPFPTPYIKWDSIVQGAEPGQRTPVRKGMFTLGRSELWEIRNLNPVRGIRISTIWCLGSITIGRLREG